MLLHVGERIPAMGGNQAILCIHQQLAGEEPLPSVLVRMKKPRTVSSTLEIGSIPRALYYHTDMNTRFVL
jgi:hypothetical protein